MKVGLGLYRHMLTREYYDFARQAGCTHVVVHLVDYFNQGSIPANSTNPRGNQPTGAKYAPWGVAGDPEKLWTVDELTKLRKEIEDAGLVLEAIENLDPAHWHDILLDGPKRSEQIEKVKTIVRRIGEAGIPILGYNFSLAGVCGRVTTPSGRGGALTLGMDGPSDEEPVPNGMVWNMIYDQGAAPGTLPEVSHDELWQRLQRFLEDIIPVAEASGVRLAAHPDDPPMPTMRGQSRLVYQPRMYQRLLDAVPSPANALEFCVGTLAEMTEGNIYETVDRYSRQGKLAYVHLRNVTGKVPHYRETFIDEGDVDMIRILTILNKNHFSGLLIPDHTPQMSCAAPWHAGMAHTLGYILAVKAMLESENGLDESRKELSTSRPAH
jgi:mannonate dehydratase